MTPQGSDSGISGDQIRTILEWAKETPEVLALRLFGSRAKGCAEPDSDLDVAITASDGNYVALADQWEANLRLTKGLKVNLKQYNGPYNDKVREYCADFSVVLFERGT
jgi:predicted nucleotidyltransferase